MKPRRLRGSFARGLIAALTLLLAGAVLAAPGHRSGTHGAGAIRDSCPDPNMNVWGIEWVNGDLWTVSWDGTMSHLVDCQTVEVFSINTFRGFCTGLGWDTRRNRWIVTDAKLNEINFVDMKGNILLTWPSPGTGPVGAGYDSLRDWIWISDFERDTLYGIWAANGTILRRYPLPGHQFWAGAAYDKSLDAIYVHDRVLDPDQVAHYISASTGAILGSFSLPYGSLNGYNDNAIGPDGTLWIDHDTLNRIYAFERSTTPTRATSWGELKAKYRGR